MDDEGPTIKPVGLTKKQELNNHIVLMRKSVRQAKVHVVRKLTREVAKLRSRKGSDEVRSKCQRKAERLYHEIISIKNLEEDRVSISALRNSLKLVDVLQNTESTPEQRALSRLSHHPSVQTLVNKYREANPHWRLQIPVLLEKNPQKQKKAEKKRIEKLARKEQIKSKTLATESKTVNDSEVATAEAEVHKKENVPQLPTPAEGKTGKLKTAEKSNKPAQKKSNETKTVQSTKPKSKVDEILAAIPLKKQLSEEKLNKTKGALKVQVLKSLEDLETETKVDLEKSTSEKPKALPKSSFFLGGEDKDDDSKDEGPVSEDESPINERRKNFGNGKFASHTPKVFGPKGRQGFKSKIDYSAKSTRYSSHFAAPKPERPRDKPTRTSYQASESNSAPSVPPPAEKLHPSWEAKKRQSVGIAAFQGKKIKFDD